MLIWIHVIVSVLHNIHSTVSRTCNSWWALLSHQGTHLHLYTIRRFWFVKFLLSKVFCFVLFLKAYTIFSSGFQLKPFYSHEDSDASSRLYFNARQKHPVHLPFQTQRNWCSHSFLVILGFGSEDNTVYPISGDRLIFVNKTNF